MRAPRGGPWIVGLLLVGPILLVHVIELVRVISLPPCAEQWDAWCDEQGASGLHLAAWSHANKPAHLLQATALLLLFAWASLTVFL